jgi:hypothetical protein
MKTRKINLLKQYGGNYDDMNNNIYLKFITEPLIAFDVTEKYIPSGVSKYRTPTVESESVKLVGDDSISALKDAAIGALEHKDDDVVVETVVVEDDAAVSKVVEVVEDELHLDDVHTVKRERKQLRYSDYIYEITPAIINYLSPGVHSEIIADLKIDDDLIFKLKQITDDEDADYVRYENRGKLIECWIADNMCCPCCGENTLRRYANDSMPIIDLVCINIEHTINKGVKFFQVKTNKIHSVLFRGKPYFAHNYSRPIDSHTIHVGSRKWGQHVHNITPQHKLIDKKILCGYICIKFADGGKKLDLQFSEEKSFIVLPEYLVNLRTNLFPADDMVYRSDKSWYYKYVDNDTKPHQRIKFNLNTNKIITGDALKKLFLTKPRIDLTYKIKTDKMLNPLIY